MSEGLPVTGQRGTDRNLERAAEVWRHANEPQPIWSTRVVLGPDHFPVTDDSRWMVKL